jgi:hypothetical protein
VFVRQKAIVDGFQLFYSAIADHLDRLIVANMNECQGEAARLTQLYICLHQQIDNSFSQGFSRLFCVLSFCCLF